MSPSGQDLAGHGDERARFHLAIPVNDLVAAEHFYGTVLGCPKGRSSEEWTDWDLGGHQLVTHFVEGWTGVAGHNEVDGDDVPVPHFGMLLAPPVWAALAERLQSHATNFAIEPHVRFAGEPGEQHTMFFFDPSGNALEFKAFANDAQVFATD